MKKGWWKTWSAWALLLVAIGALNWGLVGLLDWNLVTWLFGATGWLTKTVYILIGIAGIGALVEFFKK